MKSIELFSGCGGLAKGLELAGFEHVKFVEFDKHACNSLSLNFGSEKVFHGDVQDFDFKLLNHVDVVAGGPPCQPFSLAGKHKAHSDSRDMFPYAIKAIEELQPKAFIFENVKGLLRNTFREYFDYIILRLTFPTFKIKANENWLAHLERLQALKKNNYKHVIYNVTFKLLNAADYGVPQKRERVVIVGTRAYLDVFWEFPRETHSNEKLLWDKFVTFEYWSRHGIDHKLTNSEKILREGLLNKYGLFEPEGLPWVTVRDALLGVPNADSKHEIFDHVFKDGARTYSGHTGSDIDSPAKTIKAGGHGVPGGENMIRYRNGKVRYFTTYEAKLLQTFPSSFVVSGAWGESMRQIGNAVPVRLAQTIGTHLISLLK
jgi:DNA (cytosine-5)-methyltransferase 1